MNLAYGVTLLLCQALACSLCAQTPTSVTLSVRDLWGGVLPKARITLAEIATGKQFAQETDKSGDCTISNVAPGKYKVSVDASGFDIDSPGSLEVAAGDANRADVKLRPTDLDPLTVAVLAEPLRVGVAQLYSLAKFTDHLYNSNFSFQSKSPDAPKQTMVPFLMGARAGGVAPEIFLVIVDAKWVQQRFVWCQGAEKEAELLFGLSRQIAREGLASAQLVRGDLGFSAVTPKQRPDTLGMPDCLFGGTAANK